MNVRDECIIDSWTMVIGCVIHGLVDNLRGGGWMNEWMIHSWNSGGSDRRLDECIIDSWIMAIGCVILRLVDNLRDGWMNEWMVHSWISG